MASTIKLNYDCKALASVINYDRKCDVTIWSVTDIVIYNRNMFIIQETVQYQHFLNVVLSSIEMQTNWCP
jgi:hypothetical protein